MDFEACAGISTFNCLPVVVGLGSVDGSSVSMRHPDVAANVEALDLFSFLHPLDGRGRVDHLLFEDELDVAVGMLLQTEPASSLDIESVLDVSSFANPGLALIVKKRKKVKFTYIHPSRVEVKLESGVFPGEAQIVQDFFGSLLLRKLHLQDGLVYVQATDLVGQHGKFL